MTVFTKNIDSLLSSGFFNKEHHNWVFTEKVALDKLDNLINHRCPILGGEIYNESFSFIWSWSCDRRRYENEDEYLKRSRNEAERNITRYAYNVMDPAYGATRSLNPDLIKNIFRFFK